jgi:hypothetical protein
MVAVLLVVVGVAVVGYVLVSRWRGQALNTRRLLVLPAVLTAIGGAQVFGLAGHGHRPLDLVLIGAGVVVAAGLGLARGATVAVYQRDGATWLRYRPATLWLWLATAVVRVTMTVLAHAAGATLAASGPALLLTVGMTLLGEAAAVARTAFSAQGPGWQARTQRRRAVSR